MKRKRILAAALAVTAAAAAVGGHALTARADTYEITKTGYLVETKDDGTKNIYNIKDTGADTSSAGDLVSVRLNNGSVVSATVTDEIPLRYTESISPYAGSRVEGSKIVRYDGKDFNLSDFSGWKSSHFSYEAGRITGFRETLYDEKNEEVELAPTEAGTYTLKVTAPASESLGVPETVHTYTFTVVDDGKSADALHTDVFYVSGGHNYSPQWTDPLSLYIDKSYDGWAYTPDVSRSEVIDENGNTVCDKVSANQTADGTYALLKENGDALKLDPGIYTLTDVTFSADGKESITHSISFSVDKAIAAGLSNTSVEKTWDGSAVDLSENNTFKDSEGNVYSADDNRFEWRLSSAMISEKSGDSYGYHRYSGDDAKLTEIGSSPSEPGNYTYFLVPNAEGLKYFYPGYLYLGVDIDKADQAVTISSEDIVDGVQQYTGNPGNLKIEGNNSTGNVDYVYVNAEGDKRRELPTEPNDPGIYTVTVYITGDEHYNDATSTLSYTITDKVVTKNTSGSISFEDNDNAAGNRPSKLLVKARLVYSGKTYTPDTDYNTQEYTAEADASNGYAYTLENLPFEINGQDVSYQVSIEGGDSLYTVEQTPDLISGTSAVLKYAPQGVTYGTGSITIYPYGWDNGEAG